MELKPGYKQTEAGVIPEDWEVHSLDDLGDFKNGLNKDKDSFGHGSPFVNLMDVFGVSSINSSDQLGLVDSSSYEQNIYSLKKGDILFIRSSVKPSGVGLTALIKKDLPNTAYSGFLIRFRSTAFKADKFKEHCFYEKNFRQRLINSSSVSANTNINQENLGKLCMALPPTEAEQEAIAGALSDADELIASLEKLIEKKRMIKQGAMQELLTGKKRLPGFQQKPGYKQTEVGEIPEDWEVSNLGSLGSFSKGNGIKKDESNSGEIPCVRYGEIYTFHHEIVRSFNSSISESVAKGSKLLKYGDILFAGSGETKEDIGKSVAFIEHTVAYAGGDIVILSNTRESPSFLGYHLNSSTVARQKSTKGQGDAVVHVSASALSSVLVPLPPTNLEQEAIASLLSDMDAEIEALEKKLEKARKIKAGMMNNLLTGTIRLV